MGFAWIPDESAGTVGDSYRNSHTPRWRFYRRRAAAKVGLRRGAGRHALGRRQRHLLAGIPVGRLVPRGLSRGARWGSRRATGQEACAERGRDAAGRGAHAARLADLPNRAGRPSGSDLWRHWA